MNDLWKEEIFEWKEPSMSELGEQVSNLANSNSYRNADFCRVMHTGMECEAAVFFIIRG